MVTIEIEFDDEKIQQLLQGDRGLAVLLEPILNQMLQAEMTEHLKAKPGEQTDDRRRQRNGTYERKLTTRVGTIELEVPRDREGTFQTALFQRYQHAQKFLRVEKALVLTLMQYGTPRNFNAPSQGCHHRALRARVLKFDGLPPDGGP
jgi:transposase-like protein